MNQLHRRVIPVMALCLAPMFSAAGAAADPAQPLPGPPLRYRSAFADYQPLVDRQNGDNPHSDWRLLNDAVKGDGMAGMSSTTMPAMPGMPATPAMPAAPSIPAMPGNRAMPAMPAADKGGASGPVDDKAPGHAMLMPGSRLSPTAAKARAPAAMASMPGMPGIGAMPAMGGMGGMGGHTGHDIPGNKP